MAAQKASEVIKAQDPILQQGYFGIGDIFSKLLPYIYTAAGIALLIMLIVGGIGLMTSAGDPEKMKQSYGRITHALIGFVIVFASFLIVKVVETIFGVNILENNF